MCRKFALMLTCALIGTSLWADTVVLKSGRAYRNVKAVNRGDRLFIVFSNGRTRGIARSKIKTIKLRPVRWKRGMSNTKLRNLVDEAVRGSVREEVKKAFSDQRRAEARKAREKAEQRRIRESKLEKARSHRLSALWRSAVFPGWGQHYSGRERSALIFGASGAVAFLYFLNQRSVFSSAQTSYDDGTTPVGFMTIAGIGGISNTLYFEERKRNLEVAERRANRAGLLVAALWSVNLLEIYLNSDVKLTLTTGGATDSAAVSRAQGPDFRLGVLLTF